MKNSRERFTEVLGQTCHTDVPFFPRDLTLGMDALNIPTNEIFSTCYDSKLSARCVLALQELLHHDVTVGCIFTYSLEDIGGETKFPPDGIPYASGYPLEDLENIYSINPEYILGPLMQGMKKSCEIVREKRPDLRLCINVPGPMTMAGFARGVETYMMDLMVNPDIAKDILELSEKLILNEMRFMYDGIADAVIFASANDNPDMVGEDEYLNTCLPSLKRLNDVAKKDGIQTILHAHGLFSAEDRHNLLTESVKIGIDGFQFAEGNDLEGIRDCISGKCCILGGVNAYSTLLLGPDDRIIRDTNKFLATFENLPYIMTCSCSVHRGLSLHNMQVLADTIHAYNKRIT